MRRAQRHASTAAFCDGSLERGRHASPDHPSIESAARVVGFSRCHRRRTHRLDSSTHHSASTAVSTSELGGGAMRKYAYPDSVDTATDTQFAADGTTDASGLPKRLMTAFEVAEFIGCHEETVRRAYLRGLLTSQRFGVRGRRFHPADVLDWIRRGAPTRVS